MKVAARRASERHLLAHIALAVVIVRFAAPTLTT
jgi:hypothetical protein